MEGVAPNAADTDLDGIRDGFDTNVRDRLDESQCAGDCNGDRRVTVDEVLRAVNIVLGLVDLGVCPLADLNGDQQLDITDLVRGVNAILLGCLV